MMFDIDNQNKSIKLAMVVLVILAGIGVRYGIETIFQEKSSENIQIGTKIGEEAPLFQAETVTGDNISLEDYRESIILLNFWELNCRTCREQMNYLNEIRLFYNSSDINIISVNINPANEIENILEFKEKYSHDWIFVKNPDLNMRYEVDNLPVFYVIDPDGIITYKEEGQLVSTNDIKSEIETILEQNSS